MRDKGSWRFNLIFFSGCLCLFKQCVQHMCKAMDRETATVEAEEFYDNLVTCDIKSVDCLITALVIESNVLQRLKGSLSLTF